MQTVGLAEKKNKLLAGPAHFFFLYKIIKPLKTENELRFPSIIHAYKLKTISNFKISQRKFHPTYY